MFVLALLFGCAPGEDTSGLPAGDAAAGADVYAANCAGCHGASGEGGTGPALAEEVAEEGDDEIASVVRNGEGEMPAIALDDQELADLLAYLRETFGDSGEGEGEEEEEDD